MHQSHYTVKVNNQIAMNYPNKTLKLKANQIVTE